MIRITDAVRCTGCHACASVCRQNCIAMLPDREGFLYPSVDAEKCIECGLCERTCPLSEGKTEDGTWPKAYAAVSTDFEVRMLSSSGGVFSLLAERVLERGGVVFGAAFNGRSELEHIAVESREELHRLRGSKYLQSRIGDSYRRTKELLESGRTVLFTGTPCQIGGLKACLGKEYENLICQDVVCHGVPSPEVWENYLRFREKKAGAKAKSITFREKTQGWVNYSVRVDFENGDVYRALQSKDPYMQAFLADFCLRPSCYDCRYKTKTRQSDITLADFWGIQRLAPDMNDDRGASLVFVHSEKGTELLRDLEGSLKLKEVDAAEAAVYNPALLCSADRPANRTAFLALVKTGAFDAAVKKYCTPSLGKRMKAAVRSVLAKVKRIIIG